MDLTIAEGSFAFIVMRDLQTLLLVSCWMSTTEIPSKLTHFFLSFKLARVINIKCFLPPDLSSWTRHHISGFKKSVSGRRAPYYLPSFSGVPYPYAKHYAAYAPSLPPAPPSFYQSPYPAKSSSPTQYSDASVSSYQSQAPYSSPYAYPAQSPYNYPAPAPQSYYAPASYPSQAAYPSYAPAMSQDAFTSQSQQLSYSSSSSPSYTYDQNQQTSYTTPLSSNEAASIGNSAAYLVPSKPSQPSKDAAKKLKPKPIPPDRTEKFEIRGRCKHLKVL